MNLHIKLQVIKNKVVSKTMWKKKMTMKMTMISSHSKHRIRTSIWVTQQWILIEQILRLSRLLSNSKSNSQSNLRGTIQLLVAEIISNRSRLHKWWHPYNKNQNSKRKIKIPIIVVLTTIGLSRWERPIAPHQAKSLCRLRFYHP